MATGWDNGLNQDYCRELGQWFASRLSAREDVRKAMMSNVKNKQTLYLVMRYCVDNDIRVEVPCAITRTEERAIELAGKYRQEFLDLGVTYFDFYVQGQTYYDE